MEDSDLIKALEDYPNMGVDAIENILASKYEQIVLKIILSSKNLPVTTNFTTNR